MSTDNNMTICQFLKKLFTKKKSKVEFIASPNLIEWSAEEKELLGYINGYRRDHGLLTLMPDNSFYVAAKNRLEYILETDPGKTLSHDGVSIEFSKLLDKGAISLNENLAYGYREPHSAFLQWIKSEGHERAIRGNWKYTGIVIKENAEGRKYYCQIFGR